MMKAKENATEKHAWSILKSARGTMGRCDVSPATFFYPSVVLETAHARQVLRRGAASLAILLVGFESKFAGSSRGTELLVHP